MNKVIAKITKVFDKVSGSIPNKPKLEYPSSSTKRTNASTITTQTETNSNVNPYKFSPLMKPTLSVNNSKKKRNSESKNINIGYFESLNTNKANISGSNSHENAGTKIDGNISTIKELLLSNLCSVNNKDDIISLLEQQKENKFALLINNISNNVNKEANVAINSSMSYSNEVIINNSNIKLLEGAYELYQLDLSKNNFTKISNFMADSKSQLPQTLSTKEVEKIYYYRGEDTDISSKSKRESLNIGDFYSQFLVGFGISSEIQIKSNYPSQIEKLLKKFK